jgi:hypothetical protein
VAALQAFLRRGEGQLRVDLSELAPPRAGVHDDGALVQVYADRTVGGVRVRDSHLTAVINHGNLVLLGLTRWDPVTTSLSPAISAEEARGVAAQHVAPFEFAPAKGKAHLELIPVQSAGGELHRLAWVVRGSVAGDIGNWEALVDAASGELLAFQDRNQYAKLKPQIFGGVYPVSNDGQVPDGVEQPGWPMPFADLTTGEGAAFFANSGGVGACQDTTARVRSRLQGVYARISDTCGAVREKGDEQLVLNLGVSGGTDCTIPPGRSVGDTHASRTTYYHVNRAVEQAQGYLPNNDWLQDSLLSNVNIQQTCNAFWNGSLNMFRSGGGCFNTGELAGVVVHEWGHGMDNNGVNPNISNPGDGIADVHALLKLQDSCMGRHFRNNNCGGYGDPCTSCTGIRDLDWAKHQSGAPHDLNWINSFCPGGGGPCANEVHCEGMVMAEVAWDLFARDFKAAPFNFDNNTSLELTTRLYFLGGQIVGNWYQCTPPNGGCNADGGYLNLLAADDDNGNLADGTPHISAIFGAFNRHQMACNVPAPVNSGCVGGPTVAPNVTATPIDQGANLTWPAVPNAFSYAIYRTEGVEACDTGKVKVGETTGTSFFDQGMKNGFTYYYTVLPIGNNTSCFGRASACDAVTPTAGANAQALPNSPVQVIGGDGDIFLDNCETGRATITAENNGAVALTNVRIVAVTPLTHPGTIITTPLPKVIAASLATCVSASTTFDFVAHGLAFDQTTQLRVDITADQLGGQIRSTIVTVNNTESDFQFNANRTFSFETDLEGWVVTAGTFTRQPGGAQGTGFHISSSECLDEQCDAIRTPVIRLQASSTLSLFHRYDTETPVPIPYDRANVGVVDVDNNTRTAVSPDSGKLYDLAPGAPNGTCGTTNQAGWSADTDPDCNATGVAFQNSGWTAGALNPGGQFTGRKVKLEVAYGTDPLANGYGFDFDQVRLTNFDIQTPDVQACTVR